MKPYFGAVSSDILAEWQAEYGEEDQNELEDNDEQSLSDT